MIYLDHVGIISIQYVPLSYTGYPKVMFHHCIQKSFYGDYYSGSEHMISGRIPCLFQFSLAFVNICYLTVLQPVDYLKMSTSYTSGTK